MENLLQERSVRMSHRVMDSTEECAVSGECNLPDYCPDIAAVLKCRMTPYLQNRQWSGDQLLVDGVVQIWILYLDEERCCPRTAEFSLPYSCALHSRGEGSGTAVAVRLASKYVNCRAVGPRRLEVRGAIVVTALAEADCETSVFFAVAAEGLHTRTCQKAITYPCGMVEKILTIHETPEFPGNMPPAEMLLGGECRAVVQECKLLTGKAIVKGQVYVHQLYAADIEKGDCRCLDFVLPFSQILDADGVDVGMPCSATVQILSDTHRCIAGPDGDNTMVDVVVKLLVQLQVYQCADIECLTDAYHTKYPITSHIEEKRLCAYSGTVWEKTVLPMKIALPQGALTHILDVWIETKEKETACHDGVVTIKGRWLVCVLARDTDSQVVYHEYPEEYCLEFAGNGNKADVDVVPTELHYRVIDNQLELQVEVGVALSLCQVEICSAICDLSAQTDQPYPSSKINLLLRYAQPGERVWDIGSHCHTSPNSICVENALECDMVTHPSVLLIPIEQ